MFNINIFLKFKLHNCLTDNTILEHTARVCDLSGEQGRYTLLVCLVGNEGWQIVKAIISLSTIHKILRKLAALGGDLTINLVML